MVEDQFNMETSKYTSTDLLNHKSEIMEAVKNTVTDYFKNYGITITVLGLKEGISYENPNIQKAIDEKFASEQKLVIQQNENDANIAKAEAEAKAIILKAEAEAEANKKMAQSLTQALIDYEYAQSWDGKLPTYMSGDSGFVPVMNAN
jgi:regulator of protease activity HflC (stomatin/prohibitin superfamily)